MKTITIFIFCTLFLAPTPDISTVRMKYSQAMNSAEIAAELYKDLAPVSKKDHRTLVAYKGASMALMAKFIGSKKDKREYFQEGISWIEFAVAADPSNIEIRCIRLSIQENSPKILHYRAAMESDKKMILDNFGNCSNKEIRAFVKGYVMQSSSFDSEDRKSFKRG